MKRSNYIFESVLIAITALAGFIALFSFDGTILGALWLIVLGVLQVVHSLVVGINYWSHAGIQKSIFIYWCGVALNFAIMFFGNTMTRTNNIEMVTMLIFPLMLSVYLWWIMYAYKIKPAKEETVEKI